MARNNKRQVRRSTSTGVGASASSLGRVYEREFNPDYTPVIKDLKRIGILAGSFFAILVILSFFLN